MNMTEHIRFTEFQLKGGFDYAYGVSAVDLTGNGLPDLVACDTDVGLYWFENDGGESFTIHTIHERKEEWLERHTIADIDGDGSPEIVSVDNINDSLLWFGFDGDPRDTTSWHHEYIAKGTLPGAYDVAVADFNGDGRLDVAASSWRKGNQFAWFEQNQGHWTKHMIEESMTETRTMRVADFNGNGLPDLLGTAFTGNQVVWYENTGAPATAGWSKHIIDTAPHPTHGNPADINGDGHLDVVMALGMRSVEGEPEVDHQIVWYENEGDPARCPWKKRVISPSCPGAFEAIAADLDNDGELEVLATSYGNRGFGLAVFKHEGDPRGRWSVQVLKETWNANQVIVADLTGNGYLDVIVSALGDDAEVRWWRNEGPA